MISCESTGISIPVQIIGMALGRFQLAAGMGKRGTDRAAILVSGARGVRDV